MLQITTPYSAAKASHLTTLLPPQPHSAETGGPRRRPTSSSVLRTPQQPPSCALCVPHHSCAASQHQKRNHTCAHCAGHLVVARGGLKRGRGRALGRHLARGQALGGQSQPQRLALGVTPQLGCLRGALVVPRVLGRALDLVCQVLPQALGFVLNSTGSNHLCDSSTARACSRSPPRGLHVL